MSTSVLPRLAIVGRPNVGKSSLYNRLVGRRAALVHDEPGVTRDRLYAETDWGGVPFEVIDTGGLEPGDRALIRQHIHRQVDVAVAEAQAIVLLVDGKDGLSGLDQDAANLLRGRRNDVIVAVNKIDNPAMAAGIYEFARLGLGEPIWLSAQHGLNIDALLDAVVLRFSGGIPAPTKAKRAGGRAIEPEEKPDRAGRALDLDRPIRVAIVGRPNVGKSSLVNRLIDEERILVHDEPGTTRDPVPVTFRKSGLDLVLVDTAGLRKYSKIDSPIEKISSAMARYTLEHADLAVFVMDGPAGVQGQDQRIGGLIQKALIPAVLAVNKWDLCKDQPEALELWESHAEQMLQFLPWAPRVYLSALHGFGLDRLVQTLKKVGERSRTYLTTGKLNSLLREAAFVHPPPIRRGKQLHIRYASQLKNRVATFVFKVNDKDLVHFSYRRHLENVLRDAIDLEGIPLTMIFQEAARRRHPPVKGG